MTRGRCPLSIFCSRGTYLPWRGLALPEQNRNCNEIIPHRKSSRTKIAWQVQLDPGRAGRLPHHVAWMSLFGPPTHTETPNIQISDSPYSDLRFTSIFSIFRSQIDLDIQISDLHCQPLEYEGWQHLTKCLGAKSTFGKRSRMMNWSFREGWWVP